MADITINDLTEVHSVNDSDYIAIDDGTATNKISVENFNATGAASAAQSAAAAAQSAADALDYKDAANQAKSDTQDLITSAQTIVSNASDYADAAQTSANSASGYASAASSKASQAADSAALAAGYAANVDNFAKEAKSWAIGGTGTRTGEDTDNAKYYANEAHESEINAASSESNASTSETNAAASETNASASASSASTNALKAEGYAVGSQNGTEVVSGDYFHNNAKYYKEQAATSESNASTSASNAFTSETNASGSALAASGSATSAAASATLSESWAVGGTGTRSGEDTNNAKYWAEVAAGAAGGGVTSFNGRSGIVTPEAHDYDADQVDYEGTTSGLQATDLQGAIDEVVAGLGTASSLNVATSGDASSTEVVKGDDSRLTDSRTPTSHTHTVSDITDFPTLGTAAAKDSTNAVTQNSTDLVESGAVYTEVSNLKTVYANHVNNNAAKNLLDITARLSKNTPASTYRVASYSDHGIVIDGTVANGQNLRICPAEDDNSYVLPAGTYMLSNNGGALPSGLTITLRKNGTAILTENTLTSPFEFSANGTDYFVVLIHENAATYSSAVVCPMICLKTDYETDSTWVPYAKTNKELTNDIDSVNSSIVTLNGKTYHTDDSTETSLASDDVFPFYDTSASAPKKIALSDIVGVDTTGTASASGVSYQRIKVGSSYSEIIGTKYMEQSKTLSTSADVTYTFSNAAITADSVIDPYCSIFGISPKSVTVSAGSCAVVIPKYTSAVSCKVRIYIK